MTLTQQDIAALGFNRPKKRARHAWVSKSGKVTLSAKAWKKLVTDVWFRAQGRCENTLPSGKRCPAQANDPHHLKYRSQGGSDEISNVFAACRVCHDAKHQGKREFVPWKETETYDA